MFRTRFVYRIFLFGIAFFALLEISIFSIHLKNEGESTHQLNLTDLEDIVSIFSKINVSMYLLDEDLAMGQPISFPHILFDHKFKNRVILLGIDARKLKKNSEIKVLKHLKYHNFKVTSFYTMKQNINKFHPTCISYLFERYNKCHCLFLYTREDSTWWYGNVLSDIRNMSKYGYLGISTIDKINAFEGLINKFEVSSKQLSNLGATLLVPKNFSKFINELSQSYFVECNSTRETIFKNRYPPSNDKNDQRFKHRAWKLLALVKTILDELSITFWLSSGTCLGYFRECDIIPYSNDVDIGIFAYDYSDNIISAMIAHGLILKHWFGLKNDSLELSFVNKNGLKLDIFFFYEEGDTFWNGGTQAKTGLKFKYIFPKFKLCWTLFQYLKVRVPCNTEQYIVANYGPNWFTPVRTWDWKTSPFNVIMNGNWSREESVYAVKMNPY